jgi:hypothetical protein
MVGGHAKTAFLHAAISAAEHQRQRRHGLKKKSTTKIRLRRILENTVRLSKRLSIYSAHDFPHKLGAPCSCAPSFILEDSAAPRRARRAGAIRFSLRLFEVT